MTLPLREGDRNIAADVCRLRWMEHFNTEKIPLLFAYKWGILKKEGTSQFSVLPHVFGLKPVTYGSKHFVAGFLFTQISSF